MTYLNQPMDVKQEVWRPLDVLRMTEMSCSQILTKPGITYDVLRPVYRRQNLYLKFCGRLGDRQECPVNVRFWPNLYHVSWRPLDVLVTSVNAILMSIGGPPWRLNLRQILTFRERKILLTKWGKYDVIIWRHTDQNLTSWELTAYRRQRYSDQTCTLWMDVPWTSCWRQWQLSYQLQSWHPYDIRWPPNVR